VAADPAGNVYIAEYDNFVVCEVTGGNINTAADSLRPGVRGG